jgi:hypothetical protein
MFGGVTISLILPKLIRSVTRDGIWTFFLARQLRRADILHSTAQGKCAVFDGETCLNPKPICCL